MREGHTPPQSEQARAQAAGDVRPDVATPEVLALLVGASRARERAAWSPDVHARTLAIIFDGLRPSHP